MWNIPTEEDLAKIPKLYSTKAIPAEEKIVHMHFFIDGCDWYIVEYDHDERLFYGFAILNSDDENAEWGYISFDELISVRNRLGIEVDHDLHWTPKPAGDIDNIARCRFNGFKEVHNNV